MSHGVPYFVWRDGRPRWSPSQTVRSRGFKPRDLKDGKGNFLPLEAALDMARLLNVHAGVRTSMPFRASSRSAAENETGWVYFLWVGEAIKIGFSAVPFRRVNSLRTALAQPIDVMVVISGSRADEKYLHNELVRDRLEGEWFHPSRRVVFTMLRCAARQKVRREKGSS